MRASLAIALAIAWPVCAQAEGPSLDATHAAQAGIDEVKDSVIMRGGIRMYQTRRADARKIFGEDEGSVVSLREKPEGKHKDTLSPEKAIGFDDKNPKKLTDPFPTGVRFGGADALMQSQNDPSTGNVAKISIPGDPSTTINGPRKADGSPLTQRDLSDLATGRIRSITLMDGRVLGTPSAPVSG